VCESEREEVKIGCGREIENVCDWMSEKVNLNSPMGKAKKKKGRYLIQNSC